MKIGIVFFQIGNWGGIINHTAELVKGLKELGHDVHLRMLCYQSKFKSGDHDTEGFENSAGIFYHQQKGFLLKPNVEKFAYKEKTDRKKAIKDLNKFDLLIFSVPVETKQKRNEGNKFWPEFYNTTPKKIAIIHDGNAVDSTPHIAHIKSKVTGLACVHPCAYNSARKYDIPRALILNPQDVSKVYKNRPYEKRSKAFLSLQTFKAWKHVDGLVRAMPFIDNDIRKFMAGGGLEHAYMTSETKTKDIYRWSLKDDNCNPEWKGQRIWDIALEHRMRWLGYIDNGERDALLKKVRVLIDPSWNLKYAKYGDHFNRVIVDAALMGAIPVAVNFGVADNPKGIGVVFKPEENYIMIPHDAGPKEYARIINRANNLDPSHANEIISNNFELIEHFNRVSIAKDYIKLSQKKPCGFYNKNETGEMDPRIILKSKAIMREFFGETEDNSGIGRFL